MSLYYQTFTTSGSHTDISELNEASKLLLKLYASFFNSTLIHTGMKQLTRLSQPILNKVDGGLIAMKSNMSKLITHESIYTNLANLWLSNTFPFNGTIISYEDFIKKINRKIKKEFQKESELIVSNFYNFASEIWKSLSNPETDDIKNAILATVAQAINKTSHLEGETLAVALYNMLRMLVEKRRELINAQSFFNLVKMSLGSDYYERNSSIIKTACDEYYSFAKKFLLVDFPLATNDQGMLSHTLKFLQDNLFVRGFSPLNFIERQLDTLLRLFGQQSQEITDRSFSETTQRIMRKTLLLSVCPFKKIGNRLQYPKDTKIFSNMDQYFHISDRIDDAIGLTALGYRRLRENIMEPVFNRIQIITDAVKSRVTVIMHGLSKDVIKKKYMKLRSQFQILKRCAIMLEGDAVKLIFDEKSRVEWNKNAKRELLRFYNEVKNLEMHKIVNTGVEYYNQLIQKARRTYNRARKLEYYGYSEVRNSRRVNSQVEPTKTPKEGRISRYDSEASTTNSTVSTIVDLTA